MTPPMYRGVSAYYPFCVFRLISLNFGEVPVAKNTKPNNNGGRNIDFWSETQKSKKKFGAQKVDFLGNFRFFLGFSKKSI